MKKIILLMTLAIIYSAVVFAKPTVANRQQAVRVQPAIAAPLAVTGTAAAESITPPVPPNPPAKQWCDKADTGQNGCTAYEKKVDGVWKVFCNCPKGQDLISDYN